MINFYNLGIPTIILFILILINLGAGQLIKAGKKGGRRK